MTPEGLEGEGARPCCSINQALVIYNQCLHQMHCGLSIAICIVPQGCKKYPAHLHIVPTVPQKKYCCIFRMLISIV